MRCSNCGAANPEGKKFCSDCGNMIVLPPPSPVQYVPVQQKQPYQLRVNVFCLVGAILAVISLFLPWAMVQDKESGDVINLGAFDFNESYWGFSSLSSNFHYSVTLFLIGTAIAFFCPLGGILQIIGSMGFIISTLTVTFEYVDMVFWIGSLVAMVTSSFVLLSLVYPLGFGYGHGKIDAIARLLTVSVYR